MSRIILAGPAASGKDFIRNKFAEKGFSIDCSYTTRPIRNGEVNHKDYNFITKELFMTMIYENKFFEHVEHGEYFYGTGLHEWKTSDVFIMETEGIKQLSAIDRKESVIIYVTAPRILRIQRMRDERGWDNKTIVTRLKLDIEKFRGFDKIADLVIESTDQNIQL